MNTDNDPPDAADLGALLRKIGARGEPPVELVREARAAVYSEWQSAVGAQRSQRRVRWAVAATAVLTVASGILGWQVMVVSDPVIAAAVTRTDGEVRSLREGARSRAQQAGGRVAAGETIRTSTGAHAALMLAAGLSLRLDDETTLKVIAPDRLQLIAGALYVDSPPSAQHLTLRVEALGTSIRHLGTQYQVRTREPAVQVSVREGRVALANAAGTSTGQAGERIEIAAGGAITRTALPPWDADWQWAADAAPPFAIAGQPLAAFLEWFARETGRQLIYASPAAEQAATRVRMQGSIAGLDMATALTAVLATTELRAEVETQFLKIMMKQ